MTSSIEPVLHALAVEPREARSGDTVRVVFRTRNHGSLASPAGAVSFVLPDALAACGPTEVAVDAVAAGQDVVAGVDVRVCGPLDDRSELRLTARFVTPGASYRTNEAVLLVRSRPVLDGDAGGTFVEPLDTERVRVRAHVVNEGDGPALDVRILAAAPAGCVPDGDALPESYAARLDPGDAMDLVFDARIVEPIAEVRADAIAVFCRAARCVVVPVRETHRLQPLMMPPRLGVEAGRRDARITVELRNDGWVDAQDVSLMLQVPSALRIADDALTVDGVPVSLRRPRRSRGTAAVDAARDRGAIAVTLARIPARDVAVIEMHATFGRDAADGTIAVVQGGYRAEAPFRPSRVRSLRAGALGGVRDAALGEAVALAAWVRNDGDVPQGIAFSVEGAGHTGEEVGCTVLAAGCVTTVPFSVTVDRQPADAVIPIALVAQGDEGSEARAVFRLRVRARAAAADDGATVADACAATEGAPVSATLHAPAAVWAGAPFPLQLEIAATRDVGRLVVRRCTGGVRVIAGTTTIDGRALIEAPAGYDAAGDGELTLAGIPAGSTIAIGWSALTPDVSGDDAFAPAVVLESDGDQLSVSSGPIAVQPRDPFAVQPAGVRYHIDAHLAEDSPAVRETMPEAPLETATSAARFVLNLNDERRAELARLESGLRGEGLVAHVFALRLFFPSGVIGGDDAALNALGDVLRDLFDRLYVKLRIPGFAVDADDVDEHAMRRVLVAFVATLPGAALDDIGIETLERAPIGSPLALRVLVRMLPTVCGDDALCGALARHAALLDNALARYDGAPLELFDDALAHARDRVLDEARDELVVALQHALEAGCGAC